MRPELRQFGELRAADFDRCPVWAHCHIIDYDEPWYDDTDEETFRPWDGPLPVDPSQAIFLVSAVVTSADGTSWPGLVTPAVDPRDLGTLQPHVFIGDRRFGFWTGGLQVPAEGRAEVLFCAGKTQEQMYPLKFRPAASGMALGHTEGVVEGFTRLAAGGKVLVER